MCFFLLRFAYMAASRLEFYFCGDILLYKRLQFLKNNPNGHVDIFCTDFENDPAIANIEISYCDDHAANYSMDGNEI